MWCQTVTDYQTIVIIYQILTIYQLQSTRQSQSIKQSDRVSKYDNSISYPTYSSPIAALKKNLSLTLYSFLVYRQLISSNRSKVQSMERLPHSYGQSKDSLWTVTELKGLCVQWYIKQRNNMCHIVWVSCSDPLSFTVCFKSSAWFQQFRSNPVQWSGTIRKYLSIASQNLVLYNSGETTVGILPKMMKDRRKE